MMKMTLFFLFLSSLFEAQILMGHSDRGWYHKDTLNINTMSLQRKFSTQFIVQNIDVFNSQKKQNSTKIILPRPSLGPEGFFRSGKIYRDNFTNKIYFEYRADRTLIYSEGLR